jgi:hypothetical protein
VTKRNSKYGLHREDFNSELEYLAAYRRAYRKTHKGKAQVRTMNLKRFGVTQEWYLEKLQAQEGGCAVCGQTNPGLNSRGQLQSFAVDHDHKTGKVRGLLCHNCNRAEGLLKGNAQALANYLKGYGK